MYGRKLSSVFCHPLTHRGGRDVDRGGGLQERIQQLLHKYSAENMDIEDVEYEEADLEFNNLFPEDKNGEPTEEDIL